MAQENDKSVDMTLYPVSIHQRLMMTESVLNQVFSLVENKKSPDDFFTAALQSSPIVMDQSHVANE